MHWSRRIFREKGQGICIRNGELSFNRKLPVTPEQAEGIHAATVVREGDRFFACMEYRVSVPETGSAEELSQDCAGMDRGVVIPLQLSDGTHYGDENTASYGAH